MQGEKGTSENGVIAPRRLRESHAVGVPAPHVLDHRLPECPLAKCLVRRGAGPAAVEATAPPQLWGAGLLH